MNVINMDCVAGMGLFPDGYFDSVVCDPPYELGFMGKSWDNTGIAYSVPMWREALRVLKPGGHLLAFSGSRTYHRMACAIEDAGLEIRDQIMWVYGSGFPKSLDVSKAIDKAAGAEREVVGAKRSSVGRASRDGGEIVGGFAVESLKQVDVTAPATEAAKQWDGWGTALKPAHEPICVARKPLVGTVAANVLQHGTGAINIEVCRVGMGEVDRADYENKRRSFAGAKTNHGANVTFNTSAVLSPEQLISNSALGRWPANFIHDGLPDEWSRFFYCAKASKSDRDDGLAGFTVGQSTFAGGTGLSKNGDGTPRNVTARSANIHPTVKPTDLMRYLVRLVTPLGGTVLDPFTGSGSTGKAAALEGFGFIGFELSAEYAAIAQARIDHAVNLRHTASHDKK